MRNLVSILVLVTLFKSSYKTVVAQTVDVIWAKSAGGIDRDKGLAAATDGAGNSIVTGSFKETVNFGNITLTSAGSEDIFVVKYDVSGNLLWAKRAGGKESDSGVSIATDKSGNSFVTGSFYGTAAFDNISLNSEGFNDIFIAKYDASGNVVWAKRAGGTNTDRGQGIATDQANNCIIIGAFSSTATFDNITLTSSSSIIDDIFVVKYDILGNVVWAKQAGGKGRDDGTAIAVDGVGNIIVTGSFEDTATFDNISLTSVGFTDYDTVTFDNITFTSAGSADIFITKYDASGNASWARRAGGTGFDGGLTIATEEASNSWVSGYFAETATFEGTTLTSVGEDDIFIAKYDALGNLLEIKQAGSANTDPDDVLESGAGITIDRVGNIIVTGNFYNTATFGTFALTSAGDKDIFIAKYGIAVPDISLNKVSLKYGNVLAGSSMVDSVTVTNVGNTILSVSGTSILGLNANEFVISRGGGDFSLISGQSRNLLVRFLPSTIGDKNATLRISSNDPDEKTLDVSLNGFGTAPDIAVNLHVVDYGNVLVGKSAVDTIVVSNTGNVMLNASAPVISATNADEFSIIAGGGTFSIPPQGTARNIVIRFTPITAGNKNATLQLSSDDPDEKLISVSLQGNGNRPPTVANALSNQTLTIGGASLTRNLNGVPVTFTDPDQDALTYTASSGDTIIATASISGSTLTVAAVAVGGARITVTADDGKGGTVSTTFAVTVGIGNRPPTVANTIPNQTLTVGGAPFTRNLNGVSIVFTDSDQDTLTYMVSSSDTKIAATSISGSTLTVAAVAVGSASITVTANDNKGGTASTIFTITVTARPAIPQAPSNLIVEAVSTSQITLLWRDNSTDEEGFRIERQIGNNETVFTAGANVTSYEDMNLSPGAIATYQVRAFNKGGNSSATNAAMAITATGLRGDVIPDFRLDAQDVTRVVDIIFKSAATVTRLDSAVADCNAEFPDGQINVIDVVYIVNEALRQSLSAKIEPGRATSHEPIAGELFVERSTGTIGETINLPVAISVTEPVAAVQFKFRYNSQKLTLGAPVPAAENSPLRIATAHEPGQLAVLLYRTSERCLPAGQRELLQIPLRLDAADFSVTDLQIEGELMVGENGRVMPLEVRYGEKKLQTGLPERFDLGQNYPNPFSLHAPSALGGNATTEIVYTLPTASQVRLSILNLMGQEIAVLVEARQTAGIKKVTWDGSNQAGAPANSGIYFYMLQAEISSPRKKCW